MGVWLRVKKGLQVGIWGKIPLELLFNGAHLYIDMCTLIAFSVVKDQLLGRNEKIGVEKDIFSKGQLTRLGWFSAICAIGIHLCCC